MKYATHACTAAVVGMLLTGCTRTTQPLVLETPPPVSPDPAMAMRHWPAMHAVYPNGGTYAGTTGFLFQPAPQLPGTGSVAADIGLFALNVVTMPYTLITQVPQQPILYAGVEIPADYTAVFNLQYQQPAPVPQQVIDPAPVPPPAVEPLEPITALEPVAPATQVYTPAPARGGAATIPTTRQATGRAGVQPTPATRPLPPQTTPAPARRSTRPAAVTPSAPAPTVRPMTPSTRPAEPVSTSTPILPPLVGREIPVNTTAGPDMTK